MVTEFKTDKNKNRNFYGVHVEPANNSSTLDEINPEYHTDNCSHQYINYINETLYNITDISCIFELEINKIFETIHNNDIFYLCDSKNNIYINDKNLCKIFTLIDAKKSINKNIINNFNDFCFCIERNAFGENQYDRMNKRIYLNM